MLIYIDAFVYNLLKVALVFQLAEMSRQFESMHDSLERIAYQMSPVGMSDANLGACCALLKVQASKTLEYCTREAAQIFGGNAVIREGQVCTVW